MNKSNFTTEKARGCSVLVDQERKLDASRGSHKLFAKGRKLQKFTTANSNFEKINYFSHASSYNVDICISIFSKIGLVDQSKPYTQTYLQIITSCINLQLLVILKKNQLLRYASSCNVHVNQFSANSG